MKMRYKCARANTREGRKGGKCHCAKLSHRCASVLRGWQWICSSLRLWVYTLAWSVHTYRWGKSAKVGKCRLPVIARLNARLLVAHISAQLHKVNSSAVMIFHKKPLDCVVNSWEMLVIKSWLPLGHGPVCVLISSNFFFRFYTPVVLYILMYPKFWRT
jgi:hypothetical protein